MLTRLFLLAWTATPLGCSGTEGTQDSANETTAVDSASEADTDADADTDTDTDTDADADTDTDTDTPGPETESNCTDGSDDDGDGLVDCEDADCLEVGVCFEYCDDGVDNDLDGLADCDDDDCWGLDCHPYGVKVRLLGGTLRTHQARNRTRTTLSSSAGGSSGVFRTTLHHYYDPGPAYGTVQVWSSARSTWEACDWSFTSGRLSYLVGIEGRFDCSREWVGQGGTSWYCDSQTTSVTYGYGAGPREGFAVAEGCRLAGSSMLLPGDDRFYLNRGTPAFWDRSWLPGTDATPAPSMAPHGGPVRLYAHNSLYTSTTASGATVRVHSVEAADSAFLASCGPDSARTWYRDADGDGHGVADDTTTACSRPTGYAEGADDCDDSTAHRRPDSPEICDDGIDNDCDGGPGDCGEGHL